MKKQLAYATDSYYYQTEEGSWEYDEWQSQEDFEWTVTDMDNVKADDEAHRFAKVKIYADLGLWDGRRKCGPVECNTWQEAIEKCLGRDIQDFELYHAGKYTMYIDAHHHDGTNKFKLTCYK